LHAEIDTRGARERLLILKSNPNLTGIDDEGLETLASHTTERWVKKGTVILKENEPVRSVFIVVSGMVVVRRQGLVTARIDWGGVGFLSVLAKDPNGVDAVAERDSHLLEVPVDVLFETYEENFSFLRNSLRLLSAWILDKRDNLPRRAGEGEVELGEWFDRPRTLVEKVINATKGGVLASANLDAVIDWARMAKEVRVEPGHRFWSAGDPGSYSMYIEYGRISCTAKDGRSSSVGHAFVLGSLDPMCGRGRFYDAVAETKVIAFQMQVNEWLQLLETHRQVAIDLLGVLSNQLLRLQVEDARKEALKSAA
jgi:CRP-like cAMP-binding protein